MKTLNQLLAELYEPTINSPENPEVKFIAKHVISQFGVKDGKDYAGNLVDGPPYKATIPVSKRPPMHGYDHKGQDEAVYD